MKKLALIVVVLFVLGLVVSVVISDTSVSVAEKDTYIELSTKLKKVNNLLEAELKKINVAVEVENQKYKDALQVVSDTYQSTVDLYRAEIVTIEAQLEAIK